MFQRPRQVRDGLRCAEGRRRDCKSPLSFSYSGSAFQFEDKNVFSLTLVNPLSPLNPYTNGFKIADINGDGLDDILYQVSGPQLFNEITWHYQLSDGQSFGGDKSTTIPGADPRYDVGFNAAFVDLNQDGTVDGIVPSCLVDSTISATRVARAQASGVITQTTLPISAYNIPLLANANQPDGVSRIVAIADLNGDGKPDLALRFGTGDIDGIRWGVSLNQSDQSQISFSTAFDFMTIAGSVCTPQDLNSLYFDTVGPFRNCVGAHDNDPAFVVDIDGNGINDLIVPRMKRASDPGPGRDYGVPNPNPDIGDPNRGFYALELSSLDFSQNWTANAMRHTGLSSKQMPRVFLDVNGDGLPDAVHVENGQLWVAMNRGGSYDRPVPVSISATALDVLNQPNEMRIGDFNNDGLEDIYLVSAGILLESDGKLGFVEKTMNLPVGDDSCSMWFCVRRQWDQTLDFNGDGLIDFVQVHGVDVHVLQRVGPAPALLQRVNGGALTPELRFAYKSTPEGHIPGTCVYPQNCLHKGLWVASEVGEASRRMSPARTTRQASTERSTAIRAADLICAVAAGLGLRRQPPLTSSRARRGRPNSTMSRG